MSVETVGLLIVTLAPVSIGLVGLIGILYEGMIENFLKRIIKNALVEAYMENRRRY